MELLKLMTEQSSPSGREDTVREIIKKEAERLGYEVSVDSLGSVTAHKHGKGAKLMIDAHMDEIGVIATHIDEKGFIRFSAIGGLYIKQLMMRRVIFQNGTVGVIGAEEKDFNEKAEISKLFIDIGAKNKEDAMKYVNIGDTAVFVGEFKEQNGTVISKALDNRAGCYIALKAMEKIKQTDNDIYFVFSTQEEVGLRGAKTAAYPICPDYAIAVDVTDTGDIPSCDVMDVKLGGGAAVKIMDHSVMCDNTIIAKLKELAQNNNIPYQSEIMTDGGTDAGAIALVRAGVKAGGISLPVRYIHSPSEMAKVSDIESCIELLVKACEYSW